MGIIPATNEDAPAGERSFEIPLRRKTTARRTRATEGVLARMRVTRLTRNLDLISKTICVVLNLSRFPDPAKERDLPPSGFRSEGGILKSGT
jgi:hypothetical protein